MEKRHRGLTIRNIKDWSQFESYFPPYRPKLQMQCSRWFCHSGAIDRGYLSSDAVHAIPGTLRADICWRTSQQWLSFCPQAELWQNDGIWRRNMLSKTRCCLATLLILWTSQMGRYLERLKLPTAVLSWSHIGPHMFCILLRCPTLDGTSFCQICFVYEGANLPDPVSFLW